MQIYENHFYHFVSPNIKIKNKFLFTRDVRDFPNMESIFIPGFDQGLNPSHHKNPRIFPTFFPLTFIRLRYVRVTMSNNNLQEQLDILKKQNEALLEKIKCV